MKYDITIELSLPEQANPRFSGLSRRERDRGGRVIGGDKGDLYFSGYYVEDDKTVLLDPELHTGYENLTEDEVNDYAQEVLNESYGSIGIETVTHS